MRTNTNETTTVPTLEDAAHTFAEAFRDGMLITTLAESLTCTELDALTGLLRAAGDTTAADNWTALHARGDKHGDAHNLAEADGRSAAGPCPECEPWEAMNTNDDTTTEDRR